MAQLSWSPVQLYVLAEKLVLPELMDLVMDVFCDFGEKHSSGPSISFIAEKFLRLSETSELRKYFIHIAAAGLLGMLEPQNPKDMSDPLSDSRELNEAVVELIMNNKANIPIPWFNPKCFFHCHGENKPCYRQKE